MVDIGADVGIEDDGKGGMDQLRVTGSVRGDQNRVAKAALVDATEAWDKGQLAMGDADPFLRSRIPSAISADTTIIRRPVNSDDEDRKASLKKGLQYVMGKLDSDASSDEIIFALEAVVAMNKERA